MPRTKTTLPDIAGSSTVDINSLDCRAEFRLRASHKVTAPSAPLVDNPC